LPLGESGLLAVNWAFAGVAIALFSELRACVATIFAGTVNTAATPLGASAARLGALRPGAESRDLAIDWAGLSVAGAGFRKGRASFATTGVAADRTSVLLETRTTGLGARAPGVPRVDQAVDGKVGGGGSLRGREISLDRGLGRGLGARGRSAGTGGWAHGDALFEVVHLLDLGHGRKAEDGGTLLDAVLLRSDAKGLTHVDTGVTFATLEGTFASARGSTEGRGKVEILELAVLGVVVQKLVALAGRVGLLDVALQLEARLLGGENKRFGTISILGNNTEAFRGGEAAAGGSPRVEEGEAAVHLVVGLEQILVEVDVGEGHESPASGSETLVGKGIVGVTTEANSVLGSIAVARLGSFEFRVSAAGAGHAVARLGGRLVLALRAEVAEVRTSLVHEATGGAIVALVKSATAPGTDAALSACAGLAGAVTELASDCVTLVALVAFRAGRAAFGATELARRAAVAGVHAFVGLEEAFGASVAEVGAGLGLPLAGGA